MRKLNRLTLTLALLIMAVGGAWAADATLLTVTELNTVPSNWQNNTTTAVTANDLTGFKNVEKAAVDNWAATDRPATDKCVLIYGFTNDGKAQYVVWDGSATYKEETLHQSVVFGWIASDGYRVFYNTGDYAIAPAKTEGKNEWTFTMPANNVELQVEYYPAMLTLTTNNEEWGTVKVVGMTDTTMPAGVETDKDGNIYVQNATEVTLVALPAEGYKLVSWSNEAKVTADGKQTITMTDADLTITATFAEITYNLTLDAANANTVEAGKATVKVDDTEATPDNKGVIEGVKKGQTVTMTAAQGYKFRKVEVKKKAAGKLASEVTPDDIFKVIASDGMIYDNVDAAESAGTVAQGLIVYVGSHTENDTYNHGLALALKDENSNTWGGAKDACNAKNTSTPIVGALWMLPSQGQWSTMFTAAGDDCKLRDCFSSAGGNNILKNGNYWSSTGDSQMAKYYMFSEDDWEGAWGDIQPYYNDNYNVRACIVF